MNFHFCFHYDFNFRFCFCFGFLKVFAIFLIPHGLDSAIALSDLDSSIAFLLTPRGLDVPQTINSLLLGLEVP